MSQNPCIICLNSAAEGCLIYRGFITTFMAVTTSWVIVQHVDNPTPNSCEIDLYSRFVANLQTQIATRASTGTACLYLVFCRVSQGRRMSQRSLKLPLRIRKFFSQSSSVQVVLMWGHQLSLCGHVQILLCLTEI